MTEQTEQLRYPIGKFIMPDVMTHHTIQTWIGDLDELPLRLRNAVSGLSDEQLDTPYRPDGWTVRQVISHLADGHMNAYTRTKLSLTEDEPVIKPYEEDLWANLPDISCSVEPSLGILESLHAKWVYLLRKLTPADLDRKYIHPAQGKAFTLKYLLGLYAWHGKHHLAHITALKERMNWK